MLLKIKEAIFIHFQLDFLGSFLITTCVSISYTIQSLIRGLSCHIG
jgi:hypothetical protein